MSRLKTSLPSWRGCSRRWAFRAPRARQSATLFAETHRDGVASHGLNRFPRFVRQIKAGVVRPDAEPVCAARFGPWEQWDGQLGPGNLNATAATDRAIALAKEHGLGLVALRNTNHWMRGGTYGWQAVGAGVAFIGWTNTTPNMPPWGTLTSKLGNTPVIIAIPRGDEPVVLDVAMSQFSYGKMETLQLRGEQLPLPGGYDEAGQPDDRPRRRSSRRCVRCPPATGRARGCRWSSTCSARCCRAGRPRTRSAVRPDEFGLSQVFLTFDVSRAGGADAVSRRRSRRSIDDLHTAVPAADGSAARYPGEQVLKTRAENLRLGIPVDEAVWEAITGGM